MNPAIDNTACKPLARFLDSGDTMGKYTNAEFVETQTKHLLIDLFMDGPTAKRLASVMEAQAVSILRNFTDFWKWIGPQRRNFVCSTRQNSIGDIFLTISMEIGKDTNVDGFEFRKSNAATELKLNVANAKL